MDEFNKPSKISRIEERLYAALQPTHLSLIDESHLHAGHVGRQGFGNDESSHFAVEITSPLFQYKSLLQCHQLIYQALGDMMPKEIHALRIKVVKKT
jgi:BolA protein